MRHDLRQVELGVGVFGEEVSDLRGGGSMRVRPASERQARDAPPDLFPQLPRVLDASPRSDALVAPKYNQCLESVVMRPVCVRETVVERVLAGEERHDSRARYVAAQIDHEVAEIVFF